MRTVGFLPPGLRVGTLAAASIGVLIACGTSTAAASPSGTRQIVFAPFAANGTPAHGFSVHTTVSGHCVAAGVAGNSTYRCFAGNQIYDPCFARPKATTGPLLCTYNPTRRRLVRMDVSGPLPAPLPGAPQTRPWAMQLADGQVCVLVDAAWGGLGPFSCQASSKRSLVDCHVPTRGNPWWKTACQVKETAQSQFTSDRVVRLWT